MKISDGFTLREIAGEQVIMPTGNKITTFDGAVALNEVSAFIFSLIETAPGISRNTIVDKITSEYEVDEDTAARDLDRVLDELMNYGIVSEA